MGDKWTRLHRYPPAQHGEGIEMKNKINKLNYKTKLHYTVNKMNISDTGTRQFMGGLGRQREICKG